MRQQVGDVIEQENEKNDAQVNKQIIIRDDKNLFYYVLEIVALWLPMMVILMQTHFNIKDILLDKGGIYVATIAMIVLFRRGYGIYSILKLDKEQIALGNDKVKQSVKNKEIDILNIGEVYLCSNSAMAAGFMRMTTARKIILWFGWLIVIILSFEEIGIVTFILTYLLTIKYLTKYIISLIRKGGFEWRWYHLLVIIPKENDSDAIIITLDRKNITTIEQYLKSTLQLSLSDIPKCFAPPSEKQLIQGAING